MDVTLLIGLVAGIGGAASGVIAALASYMKSTEGRTKDRSMLLLIFDTLVEKKALDLLPVRVRVYLREISGQSGQEDSGAETAADP